MQVAGTIKWSVATKEDFVRSEAKRLGVPENQVTAADGGCANTGPTTCNQYYCGPALVCGKVYDPGSRHFYCSCIPFVDTAATKATNQE